MKPCDEGSVGLLPAKDFFQVIEHAPLVSIDLIVVYKGKVLLGKRTNRPAQGYWFVPGGRVRKNETLDGAFVRLAMEELGIQYSRHQASSLGVYEHFYSDSVFGVAPSTHYVALAFTLERPPRSVSLTPDQHSNVLWWDINEALSSSSVHPYTQDYLRQLLTLKGEL
ncbi:GDP-mannose mannosyl hydrolase [Halomonas sp. AOP13-D3-9]